MCLFDNILLNYKTQKMEAVGYDPYPILEWGKPYLGNNLESTKNDPFETTMIVYSALKDSAINTAYYSQLERITHPNYIQKFIKGDSAHLIMDDGAKIEVSRRRKGAFSDKLKELQKELA